MFKPRGPVAGSFQHTHTVTTQWSIIVLFLVGSSTCSPHIDHSGQDSLTRIFFQLQYFSPDSRLARTKTEISGQYNMHTEDQVQNSDCRLRSLYCFQPFFQFSLRQTHKFSYHTTAQKLEGIYSISLESSHKLNSTVAIFNVQEIDTNLNHNMNEPFDRLIFSPAIHQTGEGVQKI